MNGRVELESLAQAVWSRIQALTRAADRLGRFPENPPWPELGAEDAKDVGREFALRLLRAGADPVNYRLLQEVVEHRALPLVELAGRLGLHPAVALERVADLVQVGLVERSLVGDSVQATAAAEAFVRLVESVAGGVAGETAGLRGTSR
ncbi:MAG: hypothetical protein QN165_10095 [Armatimonadota bacterium]|nr:hypothetical protein [Armatimonadota bacterium]